MVCGVGSRAQDLVHAVEECRVGGDEVHAESGGGQGFDDARYGVVFCAAQPEAELDAGACG